MSEGPDLSRFLFSFIITGLRSKLNDAPEVAPGNAAVASPAAVVSDCLIKLRLLACIIKQISPAF
jgi:hypothetical protein